MASICLALPPLRDLDLARLQLLGNVALQIDVQQAVLQRGAQDLDMVGKLEAALEGARGDAAIEHLGAFAVGLFLALALDGQHVAVSLDGDVLSEKPATAIEMR